MNNKSDKFGILLPYNKRVSLIGKIFRTLSIDELPSLWNIFIGDLSIVGPRLLLQEYLPLYNEIQKQRHLVRPRLTGLAQVNGRNSISWGKNSS